MNREPDKNDGTTNWLPIMLAVTAFSSAWVYSQSDNDTVRQLVPLLFTTSMGLALVLWGLAEYREGEVRGRRATVSRDEHPRIFQVLIWGRRFVPGVIMIAAGLWFSLTQIPG